VGKAVVDVLVECVHGGAEFRWCLRLIGGEQWGEDPIVHFGVEDREAQTVGGEVVGVGV
jgi:hypothetical protein